MHITLVTCTPKHTHQYTLLFLFWYAIVKPVNELKFTAHACIMLASLHMSLLFMTQRDMQILRT